MIGYLRTSVRKQPIIALYFEFENELKFITIEARSRISTDRELFYSSICLVLYYRYKCPPIVLITYKVGAK